MASLEEVLASLQLDKYIESFKKNEVDLDAAKLLNEKEFEELGLGLGPRKKLYAYFHPPAGAAPAAAASVNLIKPAAAVAAVPAAAATAKAAPKQVLSNCGKITNIMAWDWCFDSSKWSEQGAYCENRFRLAAGDEPTQILFAGNVRRGETPFRVCNIDTGTLDYDYKPSKIDEGWSDADWSGNTIVCCGSASSGIDGTLAVFDIASKKEKGVFVGKNEMSMSDVAIVTSASGAMQAVALGQGNGQAYPPMRLFDIATLTRAGKFADVYDSPPSAVQADLNNPGCFLAASHYKFWYIDARAGKAVKRFGGGAGTIHFPVNPGGVFVASDRNTNQATQVWDIGTQKVLHTLQTAQQKNFTTSCMFSNVAVTFGPQYTGSSGGQWGFSFFDLADGGKCVHELGASVYSKRQLAMSARVIVGMSESGEFTSLIRPA